MNLISKKSLLALLLLSASIAAHAAPSAPPGNTAKGKQLFYAHGCYGCHGYNGQTGARDLVGTGSPLVASEAVFKMFLRQRGELSPMLPVTRMPNYARSAISDSQVHDLYAYISSFKLNAPALEQVPTLQNIVRLAGKPYKP
jgi:mono/diheme cytochrome c family protein